MKVESIVAKDEEIEVVPIEEITKKTIEAAIIKMKVNKEEEETLEATEVNHLETKDHIMKKECLAMIVVNIGKKETTIAREILRNMAEEEVDLEEG